ncbi:MAG TPA: SDR family oxidoreductase [Steroidobacteraceae bacterium]|jgi:NADH dehydrogenase
MVLIVGATGMLGSEICRRLAARGDPVRALVRRTSNPERVALLRQLGVELVHGDLKDSSSLREACRGVDTVVSTASSTIARQEGDSIQTVDRQGQLDLLEAAEAAGVQRFVLISFPGFDIPFPLQDAKRAVEDRLRRSRMVQVILQPTCFMEVWLSPMLGFDLANARAQVLGDGKNAVSWISFLDVAAFATAAVHAPDTASGTFRLGGPEALSPLDVVRQGEQLLGKPMAVQHVPEVALRAQLDSATDPLQQSMAGLMLYCARGDVIDSGAAERALGIRSQRSVREFLGGS